MIIKKKFILYIVLILILLLLMIFGFINIKHLFYYKNDNNELGYCLKLDDYDVKNINVFLKQLIGKTKFRNENKYIDTQFSYPVKNPYFSLIYNHRFNKKYVDFITKPFPCTLVNNVNSTFYTYSKEYVNQLRTVLGIIIFPFMFIILIIVIYCKLDRKSEEYNIENII